MGHPISSENSTNSQPRKGRSPDPLPEGALNGGGRHDARENQTRERAAAMDVDVDAPSDDARGPFYGDTRVRTQRNKGSCLFWVRAAGHTFTHFFCCSLSDDDAVGKKKKHGYGPLP